MLEKEEELMAERPAAEAPGVDISAIVAADPTFDDQAFLTIARECYERIREARSKNDPQFTDAELSPELESQLKTVIAGDVASHRHHLLPGLEIRSAAIESAAVADKKMTVVVRFHLEAEEADVDEVGKVVAGDYTEREWDENWTFWRDASVDASAVDNAADLRPRRSRRVADRPSGMDRHGHRAASGRQIRSIRPTSEPAGRGFSLRPPPGRTAGLGLTSPQAVAALASLPRSAPFLRS